MDDKSIMIGNDRKQIVLQYCWYEFVIKKNNLRKVFEFEYLR